VAIEDWGEEGDVTVLDTTEWMDRAGDYEERGCE